MGQRLNIIIVSEGAIDQEGQAITSEGVKKVPALVYINVPVWLQQQL